MVSNLIEQGVVVVVAAACNTFHVTAAHLFFGHTCLKALFDAGLNQFYHRSVVLLFQFFCYSKYNYVISYL